MAENLSFFHTVFSKSEYLSLTLSLRGVSFPILDEGKTDLDDDLDRFEVDLDDDDDRLRRLYLREKSKS